MDQVRKKFNSNWSYNNIAAAVNGRNLGNEGAVCLLSKTLELLLLVRSEAARSGQQLSVPPNGQGFLLEAWVQFMSCNEGNK